MSIVDSFKDYIISELPKFEPKWLTTEYGQLDQN
jgi:hypothetical protein